MSQRGQPRGGKPNGSGGGGANARGGGHRGNHRGGRGCSSTNPAHHIKGFDSRGGGKGNPSRGDHHEPPARSKKEIEAAQQALLQRQVEEKQAKIAAADAAKKNAHVPVEQSFTYIPGPLDLEKVSDLDAHWAKGYPAFVLYLPQDNAHNSDGSFIPNSRADELFDIWNADLEELLQSKYNVFWSRILFDESISRFLDSFLRFFLRPIMWDDSYPQTNPVARSVYERVFKVLYRCSQAKEDEHLFMKTAYFGDLILSKSIFDIPRILDLCVLYSETVPQPLEHMLERIFNAQPKYSELLSESLNVTLQALAKVEEQLRGEGLRPKELHDLQMYVLNIATTLDASAEVLPSAALASAAASVDFLPAWVRFCHTALQRLQDSRVAQKMSVSLLPNIRSAAAAFVDSFFRRCFSHPTPGSVQELHALVTVLCTNAPALAKDIQHHHNLLSWLVGLARSHPPLQPSVDTFSKVTGAAVPAAAPQPAVSKAPAAAAGTGAKHPKQPPEEQLVSLISHVRDMFPDLGEGFVERALAEFDFSAERTVDALLENNLSPALAALDKKTPRGKAAPSAATPAVSVVTTTDSLLAQRRNVFAGDQFDILANDSIAADKFHIGKREKEVPQHDRDELKKFITTFVSEYEDEPDDSLDAFEKLGVADASVDEAVNVLRRNPNRPAAPTAEDDDDEEAAEGEGADEDEEEEEGGDGGAGAAARGGITRGGVARGGGRGRGGNHHRKDRSAKKRGHLFRP